MQCRLKGSKSPFHGSHLHSSVAFASRNSRLSWRRAILPSAKRSRLRHYAHKPKPQKQTRPACAGRVPLHKEAQASSQRTGLHSLRVTSGHQLYPLSPYAPSSNRARKWHKTTPNQSPRTPRNPSASDANPHPEPEAPAKQIAT